MKKKLLLMIIFTIFMSSALYAATGDMFYLSSKNPNASGYLVNLKKKIVQEWSKKQSVQNGKWQLRSTCRIIKTKNNNRLHQGKKMVSIICAHPKNGTMEYLVSPDWSYMRGGNNIRWFKAKY